MGSPHRHCMERLEARAVAEGRSEEAVLAPIAADISSGPSAPFVVQVAQHCGDSAVGLFRWWQVELGEDGADVTCARRLR